MIEAMKHSADLSRLRSLAAMGLPEEAFVPALLEAIHRIIPSDRNLFDWTEPGGRLVRYYFEGPIDHKINQHYFDNFHNKLEAEVMPSFRDAVIGGAVIQSAELLDRPEFFRSALYNEIWRPQRLHTRMEAIVRDARDQPLGSLVLYRGPGERKFTLQDEALLARIVPYVVRGLGRPAGESSSDDYIAHRDRRAVLTLGFDGKLLQLSPDALKLLLLSHGGITPDRASRMPCRNDFPTLTSLWRNHEQARVSAQPNASMTVENSWGRFVYESCLLDAVDGGDAPVIHVVIKYCEPVALALRRALDTLPLSPTQKEVCVHLRRGSTQGEIARLMSVSASTVSDHVKKIYCRLDIHSVHELTDLLARLIR